MFHSKALQDYRDEQLAAVQTVTRTCLFRRDAPQQMAHRLGRNPLRIAINSHMSYLQPLGVSKLDAMAIPLASQSASCHSNGRVLALSWTRSA